MYAQIFVSTLLAGSASALALTQRSLCSTVSFTVSVTAQNGVYTGVPDPTNAEAIVSYVAAIFTGGYTSPVGSQTASGTFTINGLYCRPSRGKSDKLQVLVHGLTYNKDYWSGLGFGDLYNWHVFANLHGYATLAVDRVGHGSNPQRPDPFNVVQGPVHIETLHQIIDQIRTSTTNPLGRTFDRIAYVGHSYGSFLGVGLAGQYPDDIDALVLTGYSSTLNFTAAANFNFVSASVLVPERFPASLGYLTVGSASDRETAFYAGAYDHALPSADFHSQDTAADGEVAGLPTLFQAAVGFTKPVLVVTGVNDVLLCAQPLATCRAILQASGQLFPDAAHFKSTAVPFTGHDLNLHYSAPATFERVNFFLDHHL